jgi:hypothetical protein
MNLAAILATVIGSVLGLFVAIVGYLLKQWMNSVDVRLEKIDERLKAIEISCKGFLTEERCNEKQGKCMDIVKVEKKGEAKLETVEEKLFLEKWENLLNRLRALENKAFRGQSL